MAKRYQEKQDRKARVEKMRAEQRARDRRRRLAWFGGGGAVIAAVVVVIVVVAVSKGGGSSASHEVVPPALTGATTTEAAAVTVANNTGINGVVAYDTSGYPSSSHNGSASGTLPHTHVTGPVQYSVTPPVGGNHNGTWLNCGVYDKPVPNENAVHNLEHGAVWITYQPSLPQSEVSQLRTFFGNQTLLTPGGGGTGSRYIDLTPYPGLPAPIVVSSWGFQLSLTSATDPRLQQFVSKFRVSQQYTPEYGSPCTGGIGTPLQQ
jgi:hypothetical protein